MDYQTVLSFWFNEIEPSKWWMKDTHFDSVIEQRFGEIHQQANQCELFEWRQKAKGRLAEIIVLDQFARNIFRDTSKAFSSDSLVLALSQEAIFLGKDKELNTTERNFLYMPFMHSESLTIHNHAVEHYKNNGDQSTLGYEIKHRDIIEKFGRYPHRNAILQRESTAEEVEFLALPGSSF